MSNPPELPPHAEGQLPIVKIEGFGHNINFGGNVKSQAASTSAVQSFLAKQMASHGAGYWLFHFAVALIAAAAFEFIVWRFHLFSH
jgi:hypothetical protein